jgi:zinc protease
MYKLLITALLVSGSVIVAQQTRPANTGGVAAQELEKEKALVSSFFVNEVKKTGSEMAIPYKRYRLPNGLTVLIHEDHSDPVCYVDVTYHVGSAREQQGRSGFAHFFEHMMFQGSKNVADEQHFKIITDAGGILNGTTNSDRTNYFETVPSNQLEKMLWLEADRMGFLLDSVTQKKFEVQRATVKNERGQRYDNAPYGVVGEKIGEALYPKAHPYSWTTIGYIEDLDRVNVEDLKRFYMRWYGPNNAVLTVAGDVDPQHVILFANRYFGSIAQGPEVNLQTAMPVKLDSNRYISYEDQVKFPMINMAFPTAKVFSKDDAALDVLADILTKSKGSPFYKAFIESKKAVVAMAYQYSRELAGQFQIIVRANPETQLAETEKLIRATLAEWEKTGVTEDDLAKFKAQFQSNLYSQLSTVQGKGATLANFFTLAGDPNFLQKEIERYTSLTRQDVMTAYRKYIKDKPAVILSCLPKGKGNLRAKDDTWKMYDRTIETESAEYKNLTYTEPKDNFNRSAIPAVRPPKPVPVPNFYKTTINKTIPVIGIVETEIPKVDILISFKAGHLYEPKEKSGLSQLLASMLQMSTVKTSAEEIENKIQRLGSKFSISATDEELVISVEALKQNLAATMKIVEECLFEPKFDNTEFELEKKKQLDGISQRLTNASALADMAYRRLLYGEDHVLGYMTSGTAETVNALTIDDVKNFYKSLNRSMVTVAVSGNSTQNEITQQLSMLSKLPAGQQLKPNMTPAPTVDKLKIYFVDKKNAAQSEIRMGYLGLPFDAFGDYYKSGIMNFSFAGAFNSRINYLLREKKGWTYGTRGAFNGTKSTGYYTISGGFKSNTTDSTLIELFKELKLYVEKGVNDEELSFARNAMVQSDALKYESPMQKLGFVKRVLEYDLPKDYVSKQTTILNDISKEEINGLARKYLPIDKMVVVVVGDKATNLEKVKKLGYEVVEMDVNGKLVN